MIGFENKVLRMDFLSAMADASVVLSRGQNDLSHASHLLIQVRKVYGLYFGGLDAVLDVGASQHGSQRVGILRLKMCVSYVPLICSRAAAVYGEIEESEAIRGWRCCHQGSFRNFAMRGGGCT